MKLSPPNISHRDLYTLLAAVLLLAFYLFGVWYIKHLEADVRAQATQLALETTQERSMRSLSGFLAELSLDEGRLSSFFVAPEDAVGLIEQMEELGDLVNAPVSISGVHIEGENTETGEGTMVMNISAEGAWTEVTRLLALLDTFPFASLVDNVTLTRGARSEEESGQVWLLRAVMHVTLRK